jgi:hypothetical protein
MNDRLTIQDARKPKHKTNQTPFREGADQDRPNLSLCWSYLAGNFTTELQRTQKLHREIIKSMNANYF